MSNNFFVRDGIMSISPYVGGESQAPGVEKILKLSSNEGALGPSPLAIEAYCSAAEEIHRYPDGASVGLREAIAQRYKLPMEGIVCGAGSDEIIGLLCQAFTSPGEEILYTAHGFLMYSIYARGCGAVPVEVPEENMKANIPNLLAAITDKTRIIFLANPNNPTGTYLNKLELESLCESLPENILLVLDCAYSEYVTAQDYTDGHAFVQRYGNVVVTHTFSKIYALGSLRVGWAYGPEGVIDVLNRVRSPFNVNGAAQKAAVAALQDSEFLQKSIEMNNAAKQKFMTDMQELGLKAHPSAANFVLLDLEDPKAANACFEHLKSEGILVRPVGSYQLPSCLRVTIGQEEEMQLVKASLARYKASA